MANDRMWLGDKSTGLMVRIATNYNPWHEDCTPEHLAKFFELTRWENPEYVLLMEGDGQPWEYGEVTKDGMLRNFTWTVQNEPVGS